MSFLLQMALGAHREAVLRRVLSGRARPVLLGMVSGIAAALALSRLLRNQLFAISPNDPFILGSVMLIVSLAALVACLQPAYRAANVDPMVALRYE